MADSFPVWVVGGCPDEVELAALTVALAVVLAARTAAPVVVLPRLAPWHRSPRDRPWAARTWVA